MRINRESAPSTNHCATTGNELGVSIIELAICLPFLLLLIAGILQYGYLLTANIVVRQAAVTTAREALLGLPTRTDAELNIIARNAIAPMLTPTKLRAVVVTRNVAIGGVGGATQIQLIYDMRPFVSGVFSGSGPNGEFIIRSDYIVR